MAAKGPNLVENLITNSSSFFLYMFSGMAYIVISHEITCTFVLFIPGCVPQIR